MKKFAVGRAKDNDIIITDNTVSNHHAVITVSDGKYHIEDLNSGNGTFVNNRKLSSSSISIKDNIKLGNYRFELDRYKAILKDNTASNNSSQGILQNQTARSNKRDTILQTDKKIIRIGRSADNDIVLNYPEISLHHAVLIKDHSTLTIRDTESTNGTFINKRRIEESHIINKGDIIHLGSYKFSLDRFESFLNKEDLKSGSNTYISIKEGKNTVGRSDDNNIIIKHPLISVHHCIINKHGSVYEIEDLNSTNGVYVNGKRVTKSRITVNDRISLGIIPINISSGNILKSFKGDIKLDLDNIGFHVSNNDISKTILQDISLSVYPSEFIGLIGPSGSGKTTLMNIINGYVKPSEGNVFINSYSLHQNYELFRGNIGFVPQDDIIHRELTVYQSLYYSAKLRLSEDTTEEEIHSRLNDILNKLDLYKAKDVIIGSPEKTGISGGQRKRVNLAQELITQPSLLLLDEPTSGLDPKTDKEIMELLRKLADEGRIIILTTHHINETNFKLFDNIVLLSEGGRLAYYGPSYPDSIEYFNVNYPQDIFSKTDEENSVLYNQKYKNSKYFKEYVVKRKVTTEIKISNTLTDKKKDREFGLSQYFILLSRYFTIKKSDLINILILSLQAPLLGLLVGLTIGDGSKLKGIPFVHPIFVMVVCAIFLGVLNTSREIVSERAIYFRERMVMLKIPSYLFSKFTLLAFVSIVQAFILSILIYNLCDLKGNILLFASITSLLSLGSISLGFLLSSVVKTSEAAISIAIFVLIPQIIFGGTILPIGDMPFIANIISYFMLSRWSFELLVRNEGEARGMLELLRNDKIIESDDNNITGIIMLIILGIVFITGVMIFIKLRDNRNSSKK